MFKWIFNKKGQSTAEYAIVIGLVIAAVIAMQTYVKRGIQGRVAGAADKFTNKLSTDSNWSSITSTAATLKPQWEPDKLDSQSTRKVLTGTETTEIMHKGGKVERDITQKTKQAAGDYREYDY